MFYIGKHKTTNLNDSYLGSGKILKRAIKKYGKENFFREILIQLDSEDSMNLKKAEIVNEQLCDNPLSYNVSLGGHGGWGYIHRNNLNGFKKGTHASKEAMKKLMKDPEYYSNFCNRKRSNVLNFYKNGGINPRKGKLNSENHRKNISEGRRKNPKTGNTNHQFGKKWVNNQIDEYILPKDLAEAKVNKEGYTYGRLAKRDSFTGRWVKRG